MKKLLLFFILILFTFSGCQKRTMNPPYNFRVEYDGYSFRFYNNQVPKIDIPILELKDSKNNEYGGLYEPYDPCGNIIFIQVFKNSYFQVNISDFKFRKIINNKTTNEEYIFEFPKDSLIFIKFDFFAYDNNNKLIDGDFTSIPYTQKLKLTSFK